MPDIATVATSATSSKSAQKSAPGRPFAKGADSRRGRGPKKGAPNAGRPPNAFKDFLREMIRDDPTSRQALVDAAQNPAGGATFTSAWKIATDYDDAKPAEKAQITGKLTVEVVIKREGRRVTAG